jgi:hypothetical protein
MEWQFLFDEAFLDVLFNILYEYIKFSINREQFLKRQILNFTK